MFITKNNTDILAQSEPTNIFWAIKPGFALSSDTTHSELRSHQRVKSYSVLFVNDTVIHQSHKIINLYFIYFIYFSSSAKPAFQTILIPDVTTNTLNMFLFYSPPRFFSPSWLLLSHFIPVLIRFAHLAWQGV